MEGYKFFILIIILVYLSVGVLIIPVDFCPNENYAVNIGCVMVKIILPITFIVGAILLLKFTFYDKSENNKKRTIDKGQ